MTHPTNEVLANKIDNLTQNVKDGFDRAEVHFEKLNGQVDRNSAHRIKQKTHNNWVKGILAIIIVPLSFLLLRIFL